MGVIVDTLASAYLEAGDLESAFRWQTQAVKLVPATRKSRYAVANRAVLVRQAIPRTAIVTLTTYT